MSANPMRQDPRKQASRKTRNAKILQYHAPEAPQHSDGERKPFTVAEKANIFDHKGEKRFGGEVIMLTEEEANFYAKLGYLEVELKFEDERDEELAKLRSELAELKRATTFSTSGDGATDSEKSTDETKSGTTSNANGGEPSDGDIPKKPARRTRSNNL